ncbi:MAG: hypothetical protein KDA27_27455, partial [Candidatus Eisenbacteria bacterium]|nr:hypothetical protein [Candidatus Eisenbacteria bacterium]
MSDRSVGIARRVRFVSAALAALALIVSTVLLSGRQTSSEQPSAGSPASLGDLESFSDLGSLCDLESLGDLGALSGQPPTGDQAVPRDWLEAMTAQI